MKRTTLHSKISLKRLFREAKQRCTKTSYPPTENPLDPKKGGCPNLQKLTLQNLRIKYDTLRIDYLSDWHFQSKTAKRWKRTKTFEENRNRKQIQITWDLCTKSTACDFEKDDDDTTTLDDYGKKAIKGSFIIVYYFDTKYVPK